MGISGVATPDEGSAWPGACSGAALVAVPSPIHRPCPACMEYRQLLSRAQEVILKYQSKFRSLEASLDAEASTALRQLQTFEYLCRESVRLGRTVCEEDLPELAIHAKRDISKIFEGIGAQPDWEALNAGE